LSQARHIKHFEVQALEARLNVTCSKQLLIAASAAAANSQQMAATAVSFSDTSPCEMLLRVAAR
jgi:hypothetical protein